MKQNSSRIISIFTTISLIALLLISGYTRAIGISVSTDKTSYSSGEIVEIDAEINIEASEIVPLTNATIRIYGTDSGNSYLTSTCTLDNMDQGLHPECQLQDSKFQEVNVTYLGIVSKFGNRTASNATDYFQWGYGYGYGYEDYSQSKILIKIKWLIPSSWVTGNYRVDVIVRSEKDISDNYPSFSASDVFFIQQTPTTTSSTTTSSTTSSTTTTIQPSCSGRGYQTCLFLSQCQWIGDPILGRCIDRTTPETTTTIIKPECEGLNYMTCIFKENCRWEGDFRLGRCVSKQITTSTTTTIGPDCEGLNYMTCIFMSYCEWEGNPRIGRCVNE